MRKQGETAKRLRCCSRTSSASCALAGFSSARAGSGAQFEFTLAAIAQNLRRLAKLTCIHRRRRRQCVLRKRQVALELRQASQFTGSNAALSAEQAAEDRLSEAPRAGHAPG